MITKEQLYGYFALTFILGKTSNGWTPFDCPFCYHDNSRMKMSIHFDYEVVKCWACGYKRFAIQFVQDYENVSYQLAREKLRNAKNIGLPKEHTVNVGERIVSDVVLPYGFTPLMSGDGVLGFRAREYMKGRGFDIELLDSMGFGYCNLKHKEDEYDFLGYIIIPFKRRGKLYYFIGRDFIGNWRKYKNPDKKVVDIGKSELLYNEDALELSSVNYLTEGWSCAATMGDTGIACLGWSLSPKQKSKIFKSKCKKLVILPDVGVNVNTGKTYYQHAVAMGADFIDTKSVYVVDLNNLSDYGKDPNEIGRERVMSEVKKTNMLTMAGVMEAVI